MLVWSLFWNISYNIQNAKAKLVFLAYSTTLLKVKYATEFLSHITYNIQNTKAKNVFDHFHTLQTVKYTDKILVHIIYNI